MKLISVGAFILVLIAILAAVFSQPWVCYAIAVVLAIAGVITYVSAILDER